MERGEGGESRSHRRKPWCEGSGLEKGPHSPCSTLPQSPQPGPHTPAPHRRLGFGDVVNLQVQVFYLHLHCFPRFHGCSTGELGLLELDTGPPPPQGERSARPGGQEGRTGCLQGRRSPGALFTSDAWGRGLLGLHARASPRRVRGPIHAILGLGSHAIWHAQILGVCGYEWLLPLPCYLPSQGLKNP